MAVGITQAPMAVPMEAEEGVAQAPMGVPMEAEEGVAQVPMPAPTEVAEATARAPTAAPMEEVAVVTAQDRTGEAEVTARVRAVVIAAVRLQDHPRDRVGPISACWPYRNRSAGG